MGKPETKVPETAETKPPAEGYQPATGPDKSELPQGGSALAPVAERAPTDPHESTQAMAVLPVQVLRPTTFKEAQEMAQLMARTDMVPKDYRGKPANIIVAWQLGAELGLAPMQALQNIANINGRPGVWGDAALALCKGHHSYKDVAEWTEGTGDKMVAHCKAERKGRKDVVRTFSVDDAKTANLWGKNVWATYPKRMLAMRARGFALRDQWPDVLKGIHTAEELYGMEPIIEGTAEPVTVDLDKAGTQSFRQKSSEANGDQPDQTKTPESDSAPGAHCQEHEDVAEALSLITEAKNEAHLNEVGTLISELRKEHWSQESLKRVREAFRVKASEVVPPRRDASNDDMPPPPPKEEGSFGF